MNDNDNGGKKRAIGVTMMNDHGKVRLLIRTVILFDLFHHLSMLGPQYSFKLTTIFCKFCKFWRHRIGNVQILSWKGLGMTFRSYLHDFWKTPDPALPAASCALQAPGSPPYASNSSWTSSISKESNSLMKWPQHPPSHQVRTVPSCFSAANAKAVPHISYMPTSLDNVGSGQDEGCTACTPLWTKTTHSKCT